ncbi:MAG TPA: biotin carboxylase N-terminal domain-containing protein [Ktedonobacterales bacterium]
MTKTSPLPTSHAARPTPSAGPRPDSGQGTSLIRKVLVANRGEIACRVMRTCREMGIRTVAVYSDADADARHVREADEAVRIGESAAAASYLSISALLEAAHRTGADAVHPGYGFLAERADFAAACRDAGLVFIGPTPEVIARMGSKREARRMMAAAGVPVVPGYDGEDQSDARLLAASREIGFPLLVKASAGGGGKGMRTVVRIEEMAEALAGARREAQSAFGDATLLLERLIPSPRHVEFQIFGDAHGHLVHLGERECSIQRRHQKVIEETPSPALDAALRTRMAEAALTVGRTLGYTNAGTVEFVLDGDGNFYFLEVNTRLQVEHPVTELVTGLDLVRWQILVAEGRSLPLAQDEIRFTGHAVEARVYAEDPTAGYLPATGRVALWRPPEGAGIRVDAGVETGDEIGIYYDPLVAKISAHGDDRGEALRRLEYALASTVLFGLRNNLDFLRRVLLHPAHLAGRLDTGFLERYSGDLLAPQALSIGRLSLPGLAALALTLLRSPLRSPAANATPAPVGWRNTGWRNNRTRPIVERFELSAPGGVKPETALDVSSRVRYSGDNTLEIRLTPEGRRDGERYAAVVVTQGTESAASVSVVARRGPDLTFTVDGRRVRAVGVEVASGQWELRLPSLGTDTVRLRYLAPLPEPGTKTRSANSLAAPMPGQVIAVLVQPGQHVRAGEPLLVLEAMKMEHTLRAPHDGVIAALHATAGEQVAAAALLVDVQADGARAGATADS